jgi:hypothetical protein
MMKIYFPCKVFLFSILNFSCGFLHHQSTFFKPEMLSKRVFGIVDSIDLSNCVCAPICTDNNFPNYIFLNKMEFIKTISNCCDPSTVYYFKGNYQIQHGNLVLFTNPKKILYSTDIVVDSSNKSSLKYVRYLKKMQTEKSIDTIKLLRCKTNIYFREKNEPWINQTVVATDINVDSTIVEMKQLGVWNMLIFEK